MRRERARERHNRKLLYSPVCRECAVNQTRERFHVRIPRFGPMYVMVTLSRNTQVCTGWIAKEHIFIHSSATERGLEWA